MIVGIRRNGLGSLTNKVSAPNCSLAFGDPLANGLLFALFPISSSILRDLVRGIVQTGNISTPEITNTPFGKAYSNTTASALEFTQAATAHLNVTSPMSIWFHVYVKAVTTGLSAYAYLIARRNYVNESSNQGYALVKVPQQDGSNGTARWRFDTYNNNGVATYGLTDVTTTLTAGKVYNIVCTFDGTTKRIFVGGVQTASGSGSMASNTTGGMNVATLITAGEDHTLLGTGIWNRVLSTNEIRRLAFSPYTLIQPTARNFSSRTAVVVLITGKTPVIWVAE